jgi:predicted ferric reductase
MTRKIAFWLLAILFPLPMLLVLNASLSDVFEVRLFIMLGALAYSWWLASILLSVRPAKLDRWVGLPQIYTLHGILGVTALLAAYLHLENTHAHSRLASDVGHWAFYLSLAVVLYSIVFMSGWLVDRFRAVAKVKHWLEHVLRHQVSLWLHRLNLVAVVLIAVHAHVIAQIRQHFIFMLVFDLYTIAVLGIYTWKKWIAPDSYLTGTVVENRALNGSTRQVRIALDKASSNIRPGDFFFLRFEGPGISREWHPFSLSDASQDTLVLTIRQLGDYTKTVPQVPVGTAVRFDGPFGGFDGIVRESGRDKPLVLIGMGAGVAPLLSIAAGYLQQRHITLLWSIHSPSDNHYANLDRWLPQQQRWKLRRGHAGRALHT